MGLNAHRVLANIAVSDIDRARAFYEGKLGLEVTAVRGDGGATYDCAEGTAIHIYASPENVGRSSATQAGWVASELDSAVADLTRRGIEFERYDTEQIKTDENGIADVGDARAAWFRDPDGNILGLLDS